MWMYDDDDDGGGGGGDNNESILPSALLVSTCNRWLSTDITGALSSTTSFSLICKHKSGGGHPLLQTQPSAVVSCC